MRLNRNDLRKIMYEFNTLANRLLQADFKDYEGVLAKFIRFISNTEIINDYILDCGECNQDMNLEFSEVKTGRATFELGNTDEEEIRNVYAILKYAVDNNVKIAYTIAMSYSGSRKYQEILKDFNDRVTMVLIRHIEIYLTKIGIDMGMDNKVVYNITVKGGQVNIANDNATLLASNIANGIDLQRLSELLEEIRKEADKNSFVTDEKEAIAINLDVIDEEMKGEKPRKNYLKMAVSGLKAIKGTAEFSAAVAALVQFIQPLIS